MSDGNGKFQIIKSNKSLNLQNVFTLALGGFLICVKMVDANNGR